MDHLNAATTGSSSFMSVKTLMAFAPVTTYPPRSSPYLNAAGFQDWDFLQFLYNVASFAPKSQYRCLDFFQNATRVRKWPVSLNEDELCQWIKKASSLSTRSGKALPRILVLEYDWDGSSRMAQVMHCSRKIYKELETEWKCPPRMLKVLFNQGQSSFFKTTNGFGLAISTWSLKCGGCLTVYDHPNRVSSVLFQVRKDLWARYQERIEAVEEAIAIPTLFHLIYLEEEHHRVNKEYTEIGHEFHSISASFNIDHISTWKDPDNQAEFIDVVHLTIELVSLVQKMAGMKGHIETIRSGIDAVLEMHREFRKASLGPEWQDIRPQWIEVRGSLHLLMNQVQILQGLLEVKFTNTKALSDTVMSLVGSRENSLTSQAAQASKRDSADMRMIALVTFIFLPATCTATVFSTTFANWKDKKLEDCLSPIFFLYCITCVVFTTPVLRYMYRKTKTPEQIAAEQVKKQEKQRLRLIDPRILYGREVEHDGVILDEQNKEIGRLRGEVTNGELDMAAQVNERGKIVAANDEILGHAVVMPTEAAVKASHALRKRLGEPPKHAKRPSTKWRTREDIKRSVSKRVIRPIRDLIGSQTEVQDESHEMTSITPERRSQHSPPVSSLDPATIADYSNTRDTLVASDFGLVFSNGRIEQQCFDVIDNSIRGAIPTKLTGKVAYDNVAFDFRPLQLKHMQAEGQMPRIHESNPTDRDGGDRPRTESEAGVSEQDDESTDQRFTPRAPADNIVDEANPIYEQHEALRREFRRMPCPKTMRETHKWLLQAKETLKNMSALEKRLPDGGASFRHIREPGIRSWDDERVGGPPISRAPNGADFNSDSPIRSQDSNQMIGFARRPLPTWATSPKDIDTNHGQTHQRHSDNVANTQSFPPSPSLQSWNHALWSEGQMGRIHDLASTYFAREDASTYFGRVDAERSATNPMNTASSHFSDQDPEAADERRSNDSYVFRIAGPTDQAVGGAEDDSDGHPDIEG